MKSYSMSSYTAYYQFHKNEKLHIYEAMNNISVGDYIGISVFCKTDWDSVNRNYYLAPVVVKVTEMRVPKSFLGIGKGPMLKVQMASDREITVFDEDSFEPYSNRLSDPYLESAFLKQVYYERDVKYHDPYSVESISSNDARHHEYQLIVFDNSIEIKNAMEEYKKTLVSEEDRKAYHESAVKKEQEAQRKAEEERRQFEEQERQAALEIDDLFNSMNK